VIYTQWDGLPLPLELAAATAMLKEQHERPLDFVHPPSDKNTYTWGRIGEHNVVVASLPVGVYGTTSAATTESQMLSSFPYIRVELMAGIGAALARPKRDCGSLESGSKATLSRKRIILLYHEW
jgi:hypothetical protein